MEASMAYMNTCYVTSVRAWAGAYLLSRLGLSLVEQTFGPWVLCWPSITVMKFFN